MSIKLSDNEIEAELRRLKRSIVDSAENLRIIISLRLRLLMILLSLVELMISGKK